MHTRAHTKPKLIVIMGQTSTGKSDFAVNIAKKIYGEIISADSRQVYKGMDLGTGKITKKEMKGIPHHMLDVANPKKIFTVHDYKKQADKKIQEITARGHTPILCGGTGFYIDAVVDGITLPEIPPNQKLRKELYSLSTIVLFEYIKKLDPVRAETIDKNNKIRLVRAIEIAKAIGSVPLLRQDLKSPYEVLKIGLTLPDEVLQQNISTRLHSRVKKGMLKEIALLHTKGLSWKRMEALGLEYRYGALYLQGKITKQEMIKKIISETWHYAKRQKTWFKRDKNILWIDPSAEAQKVKLIRKINEFLE